MKIRSFNLLSPLLKRLLYLSLIFIFSYDLYLNDIPALFWKADKLGNIAYKLSFAYLTSFIFFYVNVHIKQRKDKRTINSYVIPRVVKIINEFRSLVQVISIYAHLKTLEDCPLPLSYPNEEQAKEIFKAINLSGPSTIKYIDDSPVMWAEYLNDKVVNVQNLRKELIEVIHYLDVDLIVHLNKIQDNRYCIILKELKKLIGLNYNIVNNTPLVEGFLEYKTIIISLQDYYETKLLS